MSAIPATKIEPEAPEGVWAAIGRWPTEAKSLGPWAEDVLASAAALATAPCALAASLRVDDGEPVAVRHAAPGFADPEAVRAAIGDVASRPRRERWSEAAEVGGGTVTIRHLPIAALGRYDGSLYAIAGKGTSPLTEPEIEQLLLALACGCAQHHRAALEREAAANRNLVALGKILAKLAHEIRNPLNAIQNAAKYLEESQSEDPTVVDFARIIQDESERLGASLTQILRFAGRASFEPEWAVVNQLVEWAAQLQTPEFATHDIRFNLELGRTAPVRVDTDGFKQTLMNLFVNARQAMPEGGEITVRTRTATMDEALAESLASGGAELPPGTRVAVLDVCDTGSGIAEDERELIFEPFYTTKQRGTGLGLAIVRDVVTKNGGRIGVESSPAGTCFRIALPMPNLDDE